ncbi:helix-turn-helix domain-containing protein [Pontibacillus salicampi]|uniref:Helix-turn-helix domain-containing protein n=1 Tax=Pontibacillus salicampi TaxID=1449801 RepID=A0ABV6LLD0_9BACI
MPYTKPYTDYFYYPFSQSDIAETAQLLALGAGDLSSDIDDNKPIFHGLGFLYIRTGTVTVTISQQELTLTAGTAVIIQDWDTLSLSNFGNKDGVTYMFVSLKGEAIRHVWELIHNQFGTMLYLNPHTDPIAYFTNMLEKARMDQLNDAYEASGYAYQFAMKLYHYCLRLESHSSHSDWPSTIMDAIKYAKEHYHQDISPGDMASACNLSRYHFARQFKEKTRVTPIQYITTLRIQRAKELLEHTSYAVEEIANLIGYHNANYFTKVFKKVTGTTPGRYRKFPDSVSPAYKSLV